MNIRKRNFISEEEFKNLQIGQKVLIRYMIGKAYVAGNPIVTPTIDSNNNLAKEGYINIEFKSGPWKGKTLNLARQQIAHKDWGDKSFPPRK